MTPDEFIKEILDVEIDDDNLHDDCELTWDQVISLMAGFTERILSEEP